jgi:hypothetical protein
MIYLLNLSPLGGQTALFNLGLNRLKKVKKGAFSAYQNLKTLIERGVRLKVFSAGDKKILKISHFGLFE